MNTKIENSSRERRIAIVVTTRMVRQGVTSVVLNLLKNMDRTNMKIIFMSAFHMDDWFCEELQAINVDIVRLQSARIKQFPNYIKELTDHLKERKINVVHVHGNSATMWFEMYAAKRAGAVVRVAHSHNSACKSRGVHYLLRPLLIRDMTIGIGCSDLAQKFAFNNKKSIVLNNGIDTERFAYDLNTREHYRKDMSVKDSFVIGHVGYYQPVKNHRFMCQIAYELKQRSVTGWKLLFVGTGNGMAEVEQYLVAHQLNDEVAMLGTRSDVAQLYQMFDLFILPSLYEGFPMVLVEAQTAGLDCLISDKVTKTANLLGTAEYLPIETDDAVQIWADAIEKAMQHQKSDREKAKEMVDEAGFSAKQSAEKVGQIYRQKN